MNGQSRKRRALVEMMTEKITNYIEVPESGILKRIFVKEGKPPKFQQQLQKFR